MRGRGVCHEPTGAAGSSRATIPASVVIPAHNRSALIRRALASVAAQRARPAEVIVIDDGSSDDTAAVAREMGARVVRHERNLGVSAARNSGFAVATQPWVAFLDSDDEWLPHHLLTLWRLRGGHVLAAGASFGWGGAANRVRYRGPLGRRPLLVRSPMQLVYPSNILTTSGVMVRREAILAVGGHKADLSFGEDWDLWIRLLEHGSGVFSPIVTVIYHFHPGQISLAGDTLGASQCAEAAYGERPWWSTPLHRRRLSVLAWDELRDLQRAGRSIEARRRAMWILSRPSRTRVVLALLARRALERRRAHTHARRLRDRLQV